MNSEKSSLDNRAVELRREYYKAWRAANPDKVKKANQNYWRRKAEQELAERQKAEE